MARPAVRERAPRPQAERPLAAMRTPIDAWMEHDFKFAGSRVKRRTVACCLVAVFALAPLFLLSRPIIQLNTNTLNQVEPDVAGTGSMLLLLATLSITPLVTVTKSHWFIPLRKWFGIMLAITATSDAIMAGLTSSFAGGFIGHLTGHTFLLVGLVMVLILAPLALISNNRSQRALGRYWKPLQRLTYVVWALLFVHLALLEGFGFQNGRNGPSAHIDGDPIPHQRLYQLTACSIPLLLLRMPPVKRWVARKQQEGKQRAVYLTFLPLGALFVLFYSFIISGSPRPAAPRPRTRRTPAPPG